MHLLFVLHFSDESFVDVCYSFVLQWLVNQCPLNEPVYWQYVPLGSPLPVNPIADWPLVNTRSLANFKSQLSKLTFSPQFPISWLSQAIESYKWPNHVLSPHSDRPLRHVILWTSDQLPSVTWEMCHEWRQSLISLNASFHVFAKYSSEERCLSWQQSCLAHVGQIHAPLERDMRGLRMKGTTLYLEASQRQKLEKWHMKKSVITALEKERVVQGKSNCKIVFKNGMEWNLRPLMKWQHSAESVLFEKAEIIMKSKVYLNQSETDVMFWVTNAERGSNNVDECWTIQTEQDSCYYWPALELLRVGKCHLIEINNEMNLSVERAKCSTRMEPWFRRLTLLQRIAKQQQQQPLKFQTHDKKRQLQLSFEEWRKGNQQTDWLSLYLKDLAEKEFPFALFNAIRLHDGKEIGRFNELLFSVEQLNERYQSLVFPSSWQSYLNIASLEPDLAKVREHQLQVLLGVYLDLNEEILASHCDVLLFYYAMQDSKYLLFVDDLLKQTDWKKVNFCLKRMGAMTETAWFFSPMKAMKTEEEIDEPLQELELDSLVSESVSFPLSHTRLGRHASLGRLQITLPKSLRHSRKQSTPVKRKVTTTSLIHCKSPLLLVHETPKQELHLKQRRLTPETNANSTEWAVKETPFKIVTPFKAKTPGSVRRSTPKRARGAPLETRWRARKKLFFD